MGWTADLGLYHESQSSRYRFALVARNIGSQFTTYDNVKERIPFSLSFGISNEFQYLPLRWHLSIDNLKNGILLMLTPTSNKLILKESWFMNSPTFLMSSSDTLYLALSCFQIVHSQFKISYNFLTFCRTFNSEIRSFSGLSFGFGVNLRKFIFNYSHARFSSAGNTNFLGLTFVP